MIYILIAAVVLLIVNLVLSFYIMDDIAESDKLRTAQLDLLKCLVDYYEKLSNDLDEMNNRNDETNRLIVGVSNTIRENQTNLARDLNHSRRLDFAAIESYMEISINTLTEICEKLKKQEEEPNDQIQDIHGDD